MFCSECGTENARGQKFCTRCGTSLLAIEYARSIVNEMAAGKASNGLEAATVLKSVAWISTIGFLTTMVGTIVLSNIYDHPGDAPVGLFFAIAGLIALIVINKQLLKLISNPQPQAKSPLLPDILAKHAVGHTTNRNLSEGPQPYYSVIEEQTRNLENQR